MFEETGHIWNAPALQKSFATLRGESWLFLVFDALHSWISEHVHAS